MAAQYDVRCFETMGRRTTCRKGEPLVRAGLHPDACYYVTRGCAISCEVDENGYTRCWGIHGPGSLVLCEEMFSDRQLAADLVPVTDCELLRMERTAFLAAVRQDSVLRLYVLQTLSQHYLDAVDGLRRATTQTIDKRLCGLLLSMAGPYARDEDSEVLIGEAFSQKTIAIMLNANRITITRTMQKLREAGLLRPSRNQHYRIASLRQLRAYMEA